jgi:hypothetical protein
VVVVKFKVLSLNLPGGNKETHANLSQDSRFHCRDTNTEPPEYEVEMLATPTLHSELLL